jgi:hypothetical protein
MDFFEFLLKPHADNPDNYGQGSTSQWLGS